MKNPDIPADDAKRVYQLRSLGILDTPAEERFDRLTRLAKRFFQVPIAMVNLVDSKRLWVKSSIGLDRGESPRDISLCGHAILGDEVLVVPDAKQDPRFSDNPYVINAPYLRFYAGWPLKYFDGSKMGTLCIIDTKPRQLNQDDLEAFKDLAELVQREMLAIELATLDDLTGISNRRGFFTLAQTSLNICNRHKIPATLVYFDIDNFKSINDTFGHHEGDHALITFARQMKLSFRDSDIYARLGGDEFVVLLTNTSLQDAQELIERFRTSLTILNAGQHRGYDVSFSSGIVDVPPDKSYSIEELLDRADTQMYEKKRARHVPEAAEP